MALKKNELSIRADKVLKDLLARYPEAGTQLNYSNPWELLVATQLSAQCTDARVNEVTPEFFRRWPDPASLLKSSREEIESVIHSTGFFRNKAKNLLACAAILQNEYNGEVPDNMEDMLKLPGVARKTASVVLWGAYGINAGLAVDTHVKRISHRLGLTENIDPVRVEQDLMPLFPQKEWGGVNYRMVMFGRDVCKARKPDCFKCEFSSFCPRLELPVDNNRQIKRAANDHESSPQSE